MSRLPVRSVYFGLTALLPVFVLTAITASAADLIQPVNTSDAERRIYAALDTDTKLEFIETPLIDIVDFLEDLHRIEIEIDTKSLDAVGIGNDTPMTRHLSGISLRSALRLLLSDLELTYDVRDEVLLITTPEAAAKVDNVRIYDVSELLREGEAADQLARVLAETLQEPYVPDLGPYGGAKAAKSKGGPKSPRSISSYRHLLIVRDTTTGHREVAEVLTALRDGLAPKPPEPIPGAKPNGAAQPKPPRPAEQPDKPKDAN